MTGRLGSFGQRLLARWVAAVCRRPAVVLLAVAVLTLAAGWVAATGLRIDVATTEMIAPHVPMRQNADAYRRAFPELDDQIAVVVDAPSADRAQAAAERVTELLRARTDVLAAVELPTADDYIRRYGLLFLDTAALDDLATRLAGAQAALGMLSGDPSLTGLDRMVGLVLGRGGEQAPAALADLLDRLTQATAAVADGREGEVPWAELVGSGVDRLGGRRVVLARPVLLDRSFGRGRPALAAVRDAIATVNAEAVGRGATLRVTGPLALRQTELEVVAGSAGLASVLSFVLVATVLIAGIRSARLILAILATLVVGMVLASGAAALSVGRLNLISVTFAVIFFGLGDDFGGHLGLRYQEERRKGLDPRRAVERAAVAVGPALALTALCAAIGFLSFVPTDYRGLAEFGIISALGMAVALFVSLTVQPAVMVLLKPGPGALSADREDRRFALWVERHQRAIRWTAAAAALGSAALLPQVRLDVNPLNLQDPTVEAVRTYRDLASRPETSPYGVNILAPDLAAADALAERMRELPGVGAVRTLSSYVPKDQETKLAILADMQLLLGPALFGPPGGPPAHDAADRAAAVAGLRDTLAGFLKDRTGAEPAVRAAAERLLAVLGRVPTDPERLAALDRALTGGLPPLLDRLRTAVGVTEPAGLDDLPDTLRKRWIAVDGRARVEVLPAADIGDSEAMRAFVTPILEIAPTATGGPVMVTEASRIVLRSFGEAVALTVALIVGLLLARQRGLADIALILAPLLLAALCTMATTALLGIPFNFANVIVVPLLFGLGVSSSIHMVERAREVARDVGGRVGPALLATSTPRAVLVSTATTATAFATLAVSSHYGLWSMGVLLALSLVFTTVSALVVLPCLLMWRPSGR